MNFEIASLSRVLCREALPEKAGRFRIWGLEKKKVNFRGYLETVFLMVEKKRANLGYSDKIWNLLVKKTLKILFVLKQKKGIFRIICRSSPDPKNQI